MTTPHTLNLSAFRLRHKLSQQQCAEIIGTNQSVVSLIEAGKRKLSRRHVIIMDYYEKEKSAEK